MLIVQIIQTNRLDNWLVLLKIPQNFIHKTR